MSSIVWEAISLSAIFFLGGVVKGVISFGLPLVTVPLLSQFYPVPVAIALSLVSVLTSSVVQVHSCRHAWPVLRQIWPMLLPLALTIPLAAYAAEKFEQNTLYVAIGTFIEVLVIIQWFSVRAALPHRGRVIAFVTGGMISGAFGGITSFYSFPSIQLLVSLHLANSEFIFATNAMFLVGSTSLGISLARQGLFTNQVVVLSLWALAPLMLGLTLGQRLRDRVPHNTFRKLVLVMLAATGVSLIRRGL